MSIASVLIVDDDRSIVRLCQRLLERASFEVTSTTDPNEAIRLLGSNKYDLLLSDIRMPVMDGFELIEQGIKLQSDMAVLVMTGFGSVDTAIQALYRGVDGLILKPFENTADLVTAVQRVLVERHQKQDAARGRALRPLFDVSETLLSETSQQALEKLIINAMLGIFQTAHAGVYVGKADGHDLELAISQGINESIYRPEWSVLSQTIQQANGALHINLTGTSQTELQAVLRKLGWGSLLISPVQRNDQTFIFFSARKADGPVFSDSDQELFTILALQSVVALENARLYTDLRDYVRRVEESQWALVQAEKMAAVGRLMASLAHEINNPLQAVGNCLHLAAREDLDEKKRMEFVNMSRSELERLTKTVRHMLDFYRTGQIEKEGLDLRTVIDRVLDLLKVQLEENLITVHVEMPVEIPAVYGVRDQIQQVIFNLVLNAMDAMDGIDSPKDIWIEISPLGAVLVVRIEDSGPGVPADVRSKLFEPFMSTKKNGTGLGLSVCYSIVEAHQGRLELVAGKHGGGACFEIALPLERKE